MKALTAENNGSYTFTGLGHQFRREQKQWSATSEKLQSAIKSLQEALFEIPRFSKEVDSDESRLLLELNSQIESIAKIDDKVKANEQGAREVYEQNI